MNRHDRRKANRGQPKFVAWSEVYELTGKGGKPISLDVGPMRRWAEKHAERISIPIDTDYIERLLKYGAVKVDRVKAVLRTQNPKPVLLCRDINDDGDEIVDGNHTYVALGLAWSTAQHDGKVLEGITPRADAYLFEPEHWQRFVIAPSSKVK
jgi:hypothetical protein